MNSLEHFSQDAFVEFSGILPYSPQGWQRVNLKHFETASLAGFFFFLQLDKSQMDVFVCSFRMGYFPEQSFQIVLTCKSESVC